MLKFVRWIIIYLISLSLILKGLDLDKSQAKLVTWAPFGIFLLFLGYKTVNFIRPLARPWFESHPFLSILNRLLAVLSLILSSVVLSVVLSDAFFPAQWQLYNYNYIREIQEAFELPQNWVLLVMFSYGAVVVLVPILKAYVRDVGEFYHDIWPQHAERVKTLFHLGADTIDKLTKWAILVTLVVYIVYDRDHKIITESFQRLVQYKEQIGDFGRKDAIESLTERNESITGINLKNATLEGLDITGGSMFYRKIRPNLNSSNFSGANLRASNLSCGFLRGVNLKNSKIRDAVLISTNLENANLANAEFGGEFFFGMTDLSYSNLRNADLSSSTLPDEGEQNTIEIYDTRKEYVRNGGAFLIGADLRGTILGDDVLGVNLLKTMREVAVGSRGWNMISDYEFFYIRDFPVMTVLSSARWDETTQFPKSVALELEKLGLRDGRITTKVQRALVDRARKAIMDVYEQVYDASRYKLLRSLEVEQHFSIMAGEAISSITGIGGKEYAGDQTQSLCQKLARFGRISAIHSRKPGKDIIYNSYKETPVTGLLNHLPYPKWLDGQTRICNLDQSPAGKEERSLVNEIGYGDSWAFDHISLTRDSANDGRSAIVKIALRYRDEEHRKRFFDGLNQEMEMAGHLNTDVNGTIVHWFLGQDDQIPLWIEHGREQLTIQLFDPSILAGLDETAVSILEKGLMGQLPIPWSGADSCVQKSM